MSKVDLIVKWICRGLGEVDMGVNVDLIATWAKRIGSSSGFGRRQSRPDIADRTLFLKVLSI